MGTKTKNICRHTVFKYNNIKLQKHVDQDHNLIMFFEKIIPNTTILDYKNILNASYLLLTSSIHTFWNLYCLKMYFENDIFFNFRPTTIWLRQFGLTKHHSNNDSGWNYITSLSIEILLTVLKPFRSTSYIRPYHEQHILPYSLKICRI